MEEQFIKLTKSDLHDIAKESVIKVLKEEREGPYWYCEFEDKEGNTIPKIVYAKSHPGAFQHSIEMGMRMGAEPKFETLRGATKQEVIAFKKMIRNRVKEHENIK
jgi:hypothetical protein